MGNQTQGQMIGRTSMSFGIFLAFGFGVSYWFKHNTPQWFNRSALEWIPDIALTYHWHGTALLFLWLFTHLMRDCLDKHKYPFILMMTGVCLFNSACILHDPDYDWIVLGVQWSWLAGIGWKLIQRSLKTSHRLTYAHALAD